MSELDRLGDSKATNQQSEPIGTKHRQRFQLSATIFALVSGMAGMQTAASDELNAIARSSHQHTATSLGESSENSEAPNENGDSAKACALRWEEYWNCLNSGGTDCVVPDCIL